MFFSMFLYLGKKLFDLIIKLFTLFLTRYFRSFVCNFQRTLREIIADFSNGDNEIRTRDPLLARQVLSQLSYTPIG